MGSPRAGLPVGAAEADSSDPAPDPELGSWERDTRIHIFSRSGSAKLTSGFYVPSNMKTYRHPASIQLKDVQSVPLLQAHEPAETLFLLFREQILNRPDSARV